MALTHALPLQGLRVVDFTWLAAGPFTTKYFADYGAEVIKVESLKQIDRIRVATPYKDGKPGINRSGGYHFKNSNKYGMTLNLKTPGGLAVAKRLIATSDLVVDNFRAGVMGRLGLGYEDLVKLKPDIIAISLSPFGSTGPWANLAASGTQIAAGSGLMSLTGWPDRGVVPPYGPIPDLIAPRFAVAALLAALSYRKRTGKGQFLDLSQYEASLTFLKPLIMDYIVNRHVMTPQGNRSAYACPHGVYRCKGDDAWCAITVFTDAEWNLFCQAIGDPDWTSQNKFATLNSRKQNEDELERLIEEWTCQHDKLEVMYHLQAIGVPAGIAATTKDTYEDPQLAYRHSYWRMKHQEIDTFTYLGGGFILEKTPARPQRPAPSMGEHTEYVCRELLHMSDEEFVDLLNQGAFE